jgi:hypothetical protein
MCISFVRPHSRGRLDWQSDPLDPSLILPGDLRRPLYIPPTPKQIRRPPTPTSSLSPLKVVPLSKPELDLINLFQGCKRSFMNAHRRKCEMTARLTVSQQQMEEKWRKFTNAREVGPLTANIRIRDEESLRRANKRRQSKLESVALPSTGMRGGAKLPREIQDTTYPRNHRLYHGV